MALGLCIAASLAVSRGVVAFARKARDSGHAPALAMSGSRTSWRDIPPGLPHDLGAQPTVDHEVSSVASNHSCGASVASLDGASVASLDGNPKGAHQAHETAGLSAALLEAHQQGDDNPKGARQGHATPGLSASLLEAHQQRYVPSLAGTTSPRSGPRSDAASLLRDGSSEASMVCIGSTSSSSATGALHVLPKPACAQDLFCLCVGQRLRMVAPSPWLLVSIPSSFLCHPER
jgi:hypothetical protein